MSFKSLKQNSATRTDAIAKLVSAAESLNKGKSYGDDRQWKPTVDKAGNGFAILRFLPATGDDALEWVRYWDHGFKGPTGRWYIEKSRTSLGEADPCSEVNSRLWNSGNEADKETARDQKRRLHYVSNVYVISDPGNPDNEGKVMLYQYGKKIFDKIIDAAKPEFADETPVDPFDFWKGADFKLKIRQVEGYRNYDKSEFDSPSPLLDGDDARLEEVYDKMYQLSEFVDPEKYKSYDELRLKLIEVLGAEAVNGTTAPTEMIMEPAHAGLNKVEDELDLSPPVEASASPTEESKEDEESLSYFAKLAQS